MYQETDSAELLELLSRVHAQADDSGVASGPYSMHHDLSYSAPQPQGDNDAAQEPPKVTTPFGQLGALGSGASPTSTHTTPAATTASATAALVDSAFRDFTAPSSLLGKPFPPHESHVFLNTTRAAETEANVPWGPPEGRCFTPQQAPRSTGFTGTEDGGHSNSRPRPTYTLSQTLFSPIPSDGRMGREGNEQDKGQRMGCESQRAGAATPPTVGKPVSLMQRSPAFDAARTTAGAALPSSVLPFSTAPTASPTAFRPSSAFTQPTPHGPCFSPGEDATLGRSVNAGHHADPFTTSAEKLRTRSVASLASLDNPSSSTLGLYNTAGPYAFMVTGSDGFPMAGGSAVNAHPAMQKNNPRNPSHVYSSLAEAFSTAAAESDGGRAAAMRSAPMHGNSFGSDLAQLRSHGVSPLDGFGGDLATTTAAATGSMGHSISPLLPAPSPMNADFPAPPYSHTNHALTGWTNTTRHNGGPADDSSSGSPYGNDASLRLNSTAIGMGENSNTTTTTTAALLSTPFQQRLSFTRPDSTTANALDGHGHGMPWHEQLRSFTAPVGFPDAATSSPMGIFNRNAADVAMGGHVASGNANPEGVYTPGAATRERGREEPQPSLRPRAPNSKHSTPQSSLQRDGSATKVKLNYYVLPSPPRPTLNHHHQQCNNNTHNNGSSGSAVGTRGGGGADIPRVLTSESTGRSFLPPAQHHPPQPQPQPQRPSSAFSGALGNAFPDGGASGGGGGVFMSSIAAQLAGASPTSHTSLPHSRPQSTGNHPQQQQQQQQQPRQHSFGPALSPYPRRPTPMHHPNQHHNNNSTNNHHSNGHGYAPSTSPTGGPGAALSPVAPLLLQAAAAMLAEDSDDKTAVSVGNESQDVGAYVAHKVLSMCRDQHGCRQLQNILTKEILAPTTLRNRENFVEALRQFELEYARALELTHSTNTNGNGNHARGASPFSVANLPEKTKETNYAASVVIPVIVQAVQSNFAAIMADAYGNFLIQKIFEIAPNTERVKILSAQPPSPAAAAAAEGDRKTAPNKHPQDHSLARNMISVACSPHGTFALQRLIETIVTEEEEAFIFAAMFHNASNSNSNSNGNSGPEDPNSLMRLFTDANGGHVLFKLTAYLKSRYGSNNSNNTGLTAAASVSRNAEKIFARLQPFLTFLLEHLAFICTHRHGCCATQKCIDFLSDVFPLHTAYPSNTGATLTASNCFTQLVERIVALSTRLASDPFGNYVLNHLIEVCFLKADYTTVGELFEHIHAHLFPYCQNKFASNVVETTLRYVSPEAIRRVCETLLERITPEFIAASQAEEASTGPMTMAGHPHSTRRGWPGGTPQHVAAPLRPDSVGKTKLEVLALDAYGNYVVQTLLNVAPVDLLLNVEEAQAGDREGSGAATGMLVELNKIVPDIRERNFGKKMLTKLELAMDRVRQQQQV